MPPCYLCKIIEKCSFGPIKLLFPYRCASHGIFAKNLHTFVGIAFFSFHLNICIINICVEVRLMCVHITRQVPSVGCCPDHLAPDTLWHPVNWSITGPAHHQRIFIWPPLGRRPGKIWICETNSRIFPGFQLRGGNFIFCRCFVFVQ